MKNTIGKKLRTVILIPFLLIFGVLLAVIGYSVTQYVTNWTELELKGISEINAADLAGRMHSVRISVLSAADVLNMLEPQMENGREFAENVIQAMFENQYVYNSWLACEPDAFDGRDSQHTQDYPGAPSGRFIRSYIMEDSVIVTAPDMDEDTLDDPHESPWYVIPRDTGSLYIDIDNEIPNLYDYGLGDEPVYTLSIVAPLHRDGRVIGCVGADVLFDVTTFGLGNAEEAAVAVFYPNGRVFFTQDLAFAEESLDTLSFVQTAKIKEAMSGGQSLFLPDEYSAFLDTRAFTYFQPVGAGDDGGSLFLYTAKPVSSVYSGMRSIFFLISAVAAVVLILVLYMFLYLTRKIWRPMKALTLAADAISQGDLETEIAPFMDAGDEIGVLSRSLHRMVEQFRVYIIQMGQSQEEATVLSQLDEFTKADDMSAALTAFSEMLCQQFRVSKATIVFIDGGRARVFSRAGYPDFMHHSQAGAMLTGKKLLYMNSCAIAQSGAEFFDAGTLAACLLPLWADKSLCGYIIFESDNTKRMMNIGAESILSRVARALADWWAEKQKTTPSQDAPESEPVSAADKTPDTPQSLFYGIDGLDAESAIAAMGGLTEIYEQSAKLLTRLIPETIAALDRYLMEDIDAFAIEIHGLKGSLNNIGAYVLGGEASRIEQMAKAGDIDGCLTYFPAFRELLSELYQKLEAATQGDCDKSPGGMEDLASALQKAGEAASGYDALEALDQMRPLLDLAFDGETEGLIREIISSLEVFDCEKAATDIQTLKER